MTQCSLASSKNIIRHWNQGIESTDGKAESFQFECFSHLLKFFQHTVIDKLHTRKIDNQIPLLNKAHLLDLPAEWNPVAEYRRVSSTNKTRVI